MNDVFAISPIGFFHSAAKYAYDVPRQGVLAQENQGCIVLENPYQQGLFRLDSFSHIWVTFLFHRNTTWRPLVLPPRHIRQKVGVFASRSPYRPNRIGLSCVRLLHVVKNQLFIGSHDLLDGTPILDIKPYLPYADSFPDADPGWTAEGEDQSYLIQYSALAEKKVNWLLEHNVPCLKDFVEDKLSCNPLDRRQKRLLPDQGQWHVLAYRTWRIFFEVQDTTVYVHDIRSAYSLEELASTNDKYMDKPLHRLFIHLE